MNINNVPNNRSLFSIFIKSNYGLYKCITFRMCVERNNIANTVSAVIIRMCSGMKSSTVYQTQVVRMYILTLSQAHAY